MSASRAWRGAVRSPWCLAFLIAWVALTAIFGFRSNELDKCYFKGAEAYAVGADPFAPTADGIGLWRYPPAMLLTAAPMAWVPGWMARVGWGAVLAFSLIGSAWCIVRVALDGVADPRERRRRAIALLIALAMAHQLILSPLTYFSHDLLIASALALALFATVARREVSAGAALGIGAALKVTPGLFAAMLLIERRWRALLAMCVIGAALTVLPDLLRGSMSGPLVRSFATMATGAADVTTAGGGLWEPWNPLAQNLSATMTRWTIPTPPGPRDVNQHDWSIVHLDAPTRAAAIAGASLLVLGGAISVVLLGGRSGRTRSALSRLNEWGAIACAMVLLAPHSSNYHFAIEYFAIASCVIVAMERRDRIMIAVIVVLALLGLPSGRDLIGNYAVEVMLIEGKLTIGALVALTGCVRAAILLRREDANSSSPQSATTA